MNLNDPPPVPFWITDSETLAPCPCGNPPGMEETMLVKGKFELVRWFHIGCLPRLRYEMEEDEDDMD